MERTYYKLKIYKVSGVWSCLLIEVDQETFRDIIIENVRAPSYAELQIEMGNKSFIDIINKND